LAEVQAANAAPSRRHSKVDPASVDVKLKLAEVAFVGFAGVAVIVVLGAARSIVHVYVAGVASVLPAGSMARTLKVWLPAASPLYELGDVQAAYAAPSRLQAKVDPASVAVNANVAAVWFVGFAGLDEIVVFGAVVSTVTVRALEAADELPAASVAVAVYEWVPSGTAVTAFVQTPPASAAVVPFEMASW